MVYSERGLEHPKLDRLLEQVKKSFFAKARRIMVFTNYRETANKLTEKLNLLEGVRAVKFIGQTNKPGDTGLTQKEQAQLLEDFRKGDFNTLVATQVAEEGIDVASSDVVIFYDNVPSAIRFIQRRGRTGRGNPGKAVILVTKDTRDEAYYWLARKKEKIMQEIVRAMQLESNSKGGLGSKKTHLSSATEGQPKLETYIFPTTGASSDGEKVTIYVDNRESPSPVIKELIRAGVNVNLTNLTVGDYILSEQIGVERKTIQDFASSIIDKRLFTQAKELSSTYNKPLIIIEGENLFATRNISVQAIRGAITSMIFDYQIPILTTKDANETALILFSIAKSEQVDRKIHVAVRSEKKPLTLAEQQEYLVSGLPNVELTLAKRLLSTFGSVEKVFNATEEELKKVHGVGNIIAEKIKKTITEKYIEMENSED
ncbi:MAG: ERCC4 domain-containing protein [Candidatus Bathyarchaeota archaeon]